METEEIKNKISKLSIPLFGQQLKLSRAPEASDLIWENHDIEDNERSIRWTVAVILMGLILIFVFNLMLNLYKSKLTLMYMKNPLDVDCHELIQDNGV